MKLEANNSNHLTSKIIENNNSTFEFLNNCSQSDIENCTNKTYLEVITATGLTMIHFCKLLYPSFNISEFNEETVEIRIKPNDLEGEILNEDYKFTW